MVTAEALIVMPRSRSRSIESSSWARMARFSTAPVSSSMRSASVDLPWSMWATIAKLRIRRVSTGGCAGLALGGTAPQDRRQERGQPSQGPSAVADEGLLRRGELSEDPARLLEARLAEEEQRIVPETAGPPRGVEDAPARLALERERQAAVGPRQGQRADEARAPPLGRDCAQALQEQRVVRLVVPVAPGEARRAHPGLAAQGLDLESRVVGQRPQPARARAGDRLEPRVAREGRLVLGHRGQTADLGGKRELKAERIEQRLELGALLGVVGRDQELHAPPRASSSARSRTESLPASTSAKPIGTRWSGASDGRS